MGDARWCRYARESGPDEVTGNREQQIGQVQWTCKDADRNRPPCIEHVVEPRQCEGLYLAKDRLR